MQVATESSQQGMSVAIRVACHQLVIGFLAALIWGFFDGIRSVAPAICGGAIGAVLTFYAGAKFLGRGAGSAQHVLMSFYGAMARKFLLAVVLFAVAVKIFGYNFAPLITAFAASLTAYWFGLLWNTGKDRGDNG